MVRTLFVVAGGLIYGIREHKKKTVPNEKPLKDFATGVKM